MALRGRSWVVSELATRLATPLATAGVPGDDGAGHLKEPIDDTFRRLGVAEADIPTVQFDDSDSAGVLALATWLTLQHVLTRLSSNFDLGRTGVNLRLNQLYKNIQEMIKLAEARVVEIYQGIPAGGDQTDPFLYVDLNMYGSTPGVTTKDWPYTTIGVGDG